MPTHRSVTAEVVDDLAHDALDLVRQGAAVGVAQHEAAGALHCAAPSSTRSAELGVAVVAVEEVLGVEQHVEARAPQELDGVGHHRDAFVERGPSASMTW